MQPILIFWGLTRAPITADFILSPIIYFCVIFLVLIFAIIYAKPIFLDKKDKSIFLASSLVGNTGNLGIPLGIALFGLQSVPYTSILNIANIFYIYIFSVYYFSVSSFNFKTALFQIFKIPAIWFAIAALAFNFFDFTLNKDFDKLFTMGAYAAIVMQLVIFGIFISQVKLKKANWKLAINISLFKHLLLPVVGFFIIMLFEVPSYVGAIILLELMVPLAVNNVNLASLYNCKPLDTTFSVIISSFVFLLCIYFYLLVFKHFFGV